MKRTGILIAIAGVALTAASPALAQHGNRGGGIGVGGGASMGMPHGQMDRTVPGILRRDEARLEAQGDLRASDRAHLRANANSVLRDDDTNVRIRTRTHYNGAANASDRARLRANANSAVRRATAMRRPTVTSHARVNSQGSLHASDRAHVRANARSAVNIRTTPSHRR